MEIGAFSVSLSVKDIAVSKSFYENLGFKQIGGVESENGLIMRNGETTIGLFQGMFEGNILTFNPGWDRENQKLESFKDVRNIQKTLKMKGLAFLSEADPDSEGPASFMIADPDGNAIMFDQHV